MRFLLTVGLVVALSGVASAQHRGSAPATTRWNSGVVFGGVPFRTYGSPSGFGNVVFPGTGTPPPNVINPFGLAPTFVERFGRNINGTGGFRRGGFGGFGGGYAPLAWPVVVGGYPFDSSYDYQQQQQQPNVIVMAPPQQSSMPPVTINQNFGPQPQEGSDSSGVQYYRAPSAQPPANSSEDQVLFFIALKDSSVYTAVAYWVEDGTLNYITPQGRHNQVSLDLVDRDVSKRLNAGRNVDFRLPAAR